MIDGCRVSLVAAVADNGVIGAAGRMPWRQKSDLQRFRRITLGKPVIMGRRTFESIGKPLSGRDNLVVSGDPMFSPAGVKVVGGLQEALAQAAETARKTGAHEIMIIGGGAIYAASLPFVDRLYLTHVHGSPDGDTHFPSYAREEWRAVESENQAAGADDSYPVTFAIYERVGHGPRSAA